jgi:hemolysin activation/secretion protein
MMGLDASYNIVRTRAFSAFAGIALQQRKLNNDQFGSSISQRTLDAATLKGSLLWSGLADHAMTLGLTLGHADLADNRGDLLADSRTAQLAGGYQKLSLGYQQYRPLTAHTQFRLNINGQLSDKNLDPSEKLSLGGLTGVRAYPYGEAMGDQGGIAQAELVYSPSNDWQLIGFVDYGRIRRNRNAWPGMAAANGYALKGYGIGALWRPTRQFSLHAIAAAPFGNNPGAAVITHADSDGRNPGARLWLVGTWAF